jgi:hypothetical protein
LKRTKIELKNNKETVRLLATFKLTNTIVLSVHNDPIEEQSSRLKCGLTAKAFIGAFGVCFSRCQTPAIAVMRCVLSTRWRQRDSRFGRKILAVHSNSLHDILLSIIKIKHENRLLKNLSPIIRQFIHLW